MLRTKALVVSSAVLGSLAGCVWTGDRGLGGNGNGGEAGAGAGSTGTGNRGGRGGSAGAPVREDAGPPSLDGACMVVRNPVQALPADLLLVLDKSGSMAQDPTTGMNCNVAGCTKWEQAIAGVNMAIMQTETTSRWGLKFFAETGQCGVGNNVAVPIGNMSAAAIATAIAGSGGPNGGTPTRAAVTNGGAYLRALPDVNPKFIVLATDGAPTCLNNNNGMRDDMAAIQAVTDQAAMGIPTFVIGIATVSDMAANTTLTEMAMRGGYPRATVPPYYPASNTAELVAALGMISGQVAHSCIYPLGASARTIQDERQIGVYGDGTLIPYDATKTNGWAFTTAAAPFSAIQLFGAACAAVTNMTVSNIEIALTCIIP